MKNKKQTLDRGAFEHALYSFRAPEYQHHEKSLLWFLIAGGVAALLVVYGLMSDGWTFSVAILVFSGTYYLFHRTKPDDVDIVISRVGVKIGRHYFPYSHIKYFWIVYDPPFVGKLYLRMTSRVHPDIFVSLEHTDIAEVRKNLRAHIDEMKGIHEPFSDTLVRLFKL